MLGSSSKLRNLATIAAMMAGSIAPPGRQHGNRHQPKDTAPNDDTPNERHPRQRRRYSDRRGSKRYRKAMQRTRTQRAIEAQGKPDTKANRVKGYPLARLSKVEFPPPGQLTQRVGHPVRVILEMDRRGWHVETTRAIANLLDTDRTKAASLAMAKT